MKCCFPGCRIHFEHFGYTCCAAALALVYRRSGYPPETDRVLITESLVCYIGQVLYQLVRSAR